MSTTAQIFMKGKSQVLMLPSKLRVQAKEMRVEQIGNDLWLHPAIWGSGCGSFMPLQKPCLLIF
jgi:hypothetical protein